MVRIVFLLVVIVAVLLGTDGHGTTAFLLVLGAGVVGLTPAVLAIARGVRGGSPDESDDD